MYVYIHKLSYSKDDFSIKEITEDKIEEISINYKWLDRPTFRTQKHTYLDLCGMLQPVFSSICNHYLYFFDMRKWNRVEIAKFLIKNRPPTNKDKVKILERVATLKEE